MSRAELVKEIKNNGIVAIIRTKYPDKLIKIAEAIFEGGVKFIEITMTVPNALKMIKEVRTSVSDEIILGVGSVLFPADILGMKFFKSVKAPMPDLNLMPTGGVNLDNAGDWINAGACAVGIGTALLDVKAIEQNNYKKLTENARRINDSIKSAVSNN
ncbi:MAG: 2-dehydro-3-deoxyphosphogluconate aldolase [Ignavibacteriaceae bacterium]